MIDTSRDEESEHITVYRSVPPGKCWYRCGKDKLCSLYQAWYDEWRVCGNDKEYPSWCPTTDEKEL